MTFQTINIDTWYRKPYFEHFLHTTPATFSMCANVEISYLLTKARTANVNFYPMFLYMVTKIVNAHSEFRMDWKEDGQLGYWDKMMPSYTIFHNNSKLFSNLWTIYDEDFSVFYANYLEDISVYGAIETLHPKPNAPKNGVPISCIPWTSFTGFNLNIANGSSYLLPIITSGKFFQDGEKILLPLAVQVHHAVCDGYHASLFFNEFQQLADSCDEWL
ncbi:type A chloramphenicol O-acetyltransferase [Paenibacillus yanchengensis]|uniref:Chloramphenicol acetyltransferase n=1 Tax=Paenibacillus yanchengensis TaxID=2035833 RepID=A0ABW4YFF5_9BACL